MIFTLVGTLLIAVAVTREGLARKWSTRKMALVSFGAGALFAIFGTWFDALAAELPIEKLRASTVHLSNGSGSVVVGKSGRLYILTNWHVCLGAQWKHQIIAFYPNGETIQGMVVKVSPTKDLCAAVLKEDRPGLKMAPRLQPYQDIWTRGYPEHILAETHGNVGGTVQWSAGFPIQEIGECPEGYGKDRDYEGRVQGCTYTFTSQLSTLYARPGSSGSPVVDSEGRLVGVVSSWHSRGDYEAGMVTFRDVKSFLDGL